jgi:hypothetical protein
MLMLLMMLLQGLRTALKLVAGSCCCYAWAFLHFCIRIAACALTKAYFAILDPGTRKPILLFWTPV